MIREMENFLNWISSYNCDLSSVEMKRSENYGHGIFAKKDFIINEQIVTIEPKLIITPSYILKLPKYSQIINISLEPYEVLVLFFALEDLDTSLWSPYLRMLPATFNALVWTDYNVDATHLPYNTRVAWLKMKTEVENMYEKLSKLYSIQWNTFLWSWNIVNSRCIYCCFDEPHPLIATKNNDSLAVIPFVDMFNHSNDSQCTACWDKIRGCFKVVAEKTILEDDQIFLCYGSHSNSVLLLEYGFTMENNICNKLDLNIDLLTELAKEVGLKVSDMHVHTLKKADISCILYASDSGFNFGFKANIRLLQLQINQLRYWQNYIFNANVDDGAEGKTYEICLEILKALKKRLQCKLGKVPKKFHGLWLDQIEIIDMLLLS